MKKISTKKEKKNSGITLIALVITIIILLILAGVSIAMLTGENGILTQATNAREKTTKAEEEEKIKMAVMGSSVDNTGYVDILDETSFKQELANQFGSQSLDVVANGDGSFIITIEDTQRKYYVNDDKTVINSDNIIEISTVEELASFRDDVNSGNSYEGKAVLLTSDITLSGEWEPIGYYDQGTTDEQHPDTATNKPFKGIFDGCNHKIDNLQINTTNNVQGFFGLVINGTIRDIEIKENSSVTAGRRGGALIGYLYGLKGNIYNCINYADVSFKTGGGIIGLVAGKHTISNCVNYGYVDGKGGVLGGTNGTDWGEFEGVFNTIINCGNYGDINFYGDGQLYVGGLVGFFKGDIYNSCNKGEINTDKQSVGGIVGSIEGNIQNSYNISNITSTEPNVGGILGEAGEELGTNLTNCYSIGEMRGAYEVGEIVGHQYLNLNHKQTNCYSRNDTFMAENLGNAFKEDSENKNNGYPILYWE